MDLFISPRCRLKVWLPSASRQRKQHDEPALVGPHWCVAAVQWHPTKLQVRGRTANRRSHMRCSRSVPVSPTASSLTWEPCPRRAAGLRDGQPPGLLARGTVDRCGIPSTSRRATTRHPGGRARRRRYQLHRGLPPGCRAVGLCQVDGMPHVRVCKIIIDSPPRRGGLRELTTAVTTTQTTARHHQHHAERSRRRSREQE